MPASTSSFGLSSALTLDATINPDFGQVESDQETLNLTRFETFFPEKRPFFLEGSDLFTTPLALFYLASHRPASGRGRRRRWPGRAARRRAGRHTRRRAA